MTWENAIVLNHWIQRTVSFLLLFLSVMVIGDPLFRVKVFSNEIFDLVIIIVSFGVLSLREGVLSQQVFSFLLSLSSARSSFDLPFSLNGALSVVSKADLSTEVIAYNSVDYRVFVSEGLLGHIEGLLHRHRKSDT